MTQTGMSLGTPAYMSPEQAMGERVIGPRSDVYALGAMTYEMLVGDPPFTGSTVQAIVAKVMTEKPMAPSRIRDTIPPNVEHAVMTALQKLPPIASPPPRISPTRWVRLVAQAAMHRPLLLHVLTSSRPHVPGAWAWSPPAALILTAAGVAGWALRGKPRVAGRRDPPLRPRPSPGCPDRDPHHQSHCHLARRRRSRVLGRAGSGPLQIFVRRMDELGVHPLAGTEGGEQPFFSPDGKWIAYFANHQMKKVAVTGGPPTVLAELPGGLAYGGSWVPDGRIVVSRGNTLVLIPPGGGALSPLSAIDTATDRLLMNPKVLSDGKTVIVTRWRGSTVSAGLWVATIGEGRATDLQLPGSYVLGMIDDHLVYDTQSGVLMAVPFDIAKRKVLGQPVSGAGRHCGRCQRRGAGGDLPQRDTGLPDGRTAPACADHRPARDERFGTSRAGQVLRATVFSRRNRIAIGLLNQGTRISGCMTSAPRRSAASPRKATSTTGPSGAPTAGASSSGPIGAVRWRSGPSPPMARGRPSGAARSRGEIWEGVPTADGRA
jgi:serine/threonine-protein kinase